MPSAILLLLLCGSIASQRTEIDTSPNRETPGRNVCTYTYIISPDSEKTCTNGAETQHLLSNKLIRVESVLNEMQLAINRPSQHQTKSYPQDCHHAYILNGSSLIEGIHMIQPEHYPEPFPVYCQITDDGAWTVIQRREDGSVNFHNEWRTYKSGFGYITGEHWLGNEKIYHLVRGSNYKLRIDLEDWDQETRFAEYDSFQIGNEATKYLLILGKYSSNSTAGDSLSYHNVLKFSAKDQDNDGYSSYCCACASGSNRQGRGGWWYKNCHYANLNGVYFTKTGYRSTYIYGIEWQTWHGHSVSMKKTLMKVQRSQPCWG